MIRPLLFCLLVGGSVSAFAQDSAPSESAVLTLEQAVSIAHANNRSVRNAQLVASIDDDQIAEARTYRFPSLNLYALGSQLLTPVDFTFQRGAFGSFPGIGPVPATDTRIHTPLRPTFYGLTQFSQPLSQHFDFIEEMREKGEPLERALVDAGIVRLRPVLITVGATVLALFPLALHGGPLWKPLCYSQIGGLGVATFITLLLVPVFYSIFVLDLKLVNWEGPTE